MDALATNKVSFKSRLMPDLPVCNLPAEWWSVSSLANGSCGSFRNMEHLFRATQRAGSTARLPDPPTSLPFISHHCWRVGRNPIGRQHNPNTGGEKIWNPGESRGLHHLAISATHVNTCGFKCVLVCAHVYRWPGWCSFISHWVVSVHVINSVPCASVAFFFFSCFNGWRCWSITPKAALQSSACTWQGQRAHDLAIWKLWFQATVPWKSEWEVKDIAENMSENIFFNQ